MKSKTAITLLKYCLHYEIVGVIDSTCSSKQIEEVFGIKTKAKFFPNIKAAVNENKDIYVAYIGFTGTFFSDSELEDISDILSFNINIINGLHEELNKNIQISAKLAELNHLVWIQDLRKIEMVFPSRFHPHSQNSKVVVTVGTDFSVGKLTTAIELNKLLKNEGINSELLATGQTGVMIQGTGLVIDHMLSESLIGLVSEKVSEYTEKYDYVIVEGQGSLMRGNICLGLLQGSLPDGIIICHEMGRSRMLGYEMWNIPEIKKQIDAYLAVSKWISLEKPFKIIGISLNTRGYSEVEAQKYIQLLEDSLCLPVVDPVRFGIRKIYNELMRIFA